MSVRTIELSEAVVFRPGVGVQPSYTVSNIRFFDGIMAASARVTSIYRDLEAGQYVDHPEVGTFTLIHVNPIIIPFAVGGSPTATFRFVPAPGFITFWDKESETDQ